jgi:hypothetical protein
MQAYLLFFLNIENKFLSGPEGDRTPTSLTYEVSAFTNLATGPFFTPLNYRGDYL